MTGRLSRPELVAIAGAVPVLLLCGWWAIDDGGYFPSQWMPGTVAVLVLLAVIVVSLGRAAVRRPTRAARAAIACLSAYTLWSFASILWADAPGTALEGSQRTLLYLAAFVTSALLPWTRRTLLCVVGAFVAVIAAAGIVVVVRVGAADDPLPYFVNARLAAPLGYQNATAALWTMAALPGLLLASRREVSAWIRPLLLAASGLLLGLAVLAQSRGWLFTLPVVAIGTLLLAPGRVRLAIFALPVAAAVVLSTGALLEPYAQTALLAPSDARPVLAATFDDAATALLRVSLALLAIGAALVAIDIRFGERLTAGPSVRRTLNGALVAMVLCGALVGGLVATDGDPVGGVDRAWTQFKDLQSGSAGSTRFSELGSNRYDLWRVALDQWRENPVFGLGQDNYAQAYVAERASATEEPRWVHSLQLRLLVHTGAPGALFFLGFAAAALWAAVGAWRGGGRSACARSAGVAALLPALVWAMHGSVDWFWEYPALTVPVFALLGAAGARRPRVPADPGDAPSGSGRAQRVAAAAAVAIALAGAAVVIPSYVAQLDVDDAASDWPSNPAGAFARLDRAQSLNGLSARPSLVEGFVAIELGRLDRAEQAFRSAAQREPKDWLARFELGLIAGVRGDRGPALAQLGAARALNPYDGLVREALARVRAGRPMGFAEAAREFRERQARRQGQL